MKRTLSLVLIAALLLCSFSVFAAADVPTPLCYITLPQENDKFICLPCEGFSNFVPRGGSFEFYIQAKDGYSVKSATVSIDGMIFYETDFVDEYFPGTNARTFRIDNVVKDSEIKVTTVLEEEKSDLFAWLITFISKFFEFIKDIFGNGFAI